MKRILFQGDSVTDADRNRENPGSMGDGYPNIVRANLGLKYPGEYEFLNRGVSGNRIVNLFERTKADLINLKPDYLSILIGINDVWHEVSRQNGVDAEKFEWVYRELIREVKTALPDLKILIMEPFVLHGTATENTEEIPDRWEYFSLETPKRAAVARKIAEEFDLDFLPLQEKFTQAAASTSPSLWLRDGVHPTPAGHTLIAREWMKAFENKFGKEAK